MKTNITNSNREINDIINKIDIIRYKIKDPYSYNKLSQIIQDFLVVDGQLEMDRLIQPLTKKFTSKDKKFMQKKWIQFLSKNKNPFLSLYIHIPFCIKRCKFCEYYSTIVENKSELNKYMTYLEEEIKYFAPIFSNNMFTNIYIGGGTPTILNNEQIEKLFKLIYDNFNIKTDGQHTLEISPYVINKKKIDIAKKYVNRISLGIQSLDKTVLEKNNRPYVSYDRLKELFRYIKNKNFQSFDVDYIMGLDGDTSEKFIEGFENLLKLGPYSISLYKLHQGDRTGKFIQTKYPNQKGNINICKDYTFAQYSMRDILNKIRPLIKKYNYHGFNSNEYKTPRFWRGNTSQKKSIENWYLPYYNSKTHNSILGIGIGAESYITHEFESINIHNIKGEYKFKNTEYYICNILEKDQMKSYIISTLTSQTGTAEISVNNFKKRFNKNIYDEFKEEITILKKMGMLVTYKDKILLFPRNDYEKAFATRLFGM